MNRAELKLKFTTSKLEPTQDPDKWIGDLEEIRNDLGKLGTSISDEDVMIHILNNLPCEYESLVETLLGQITTCDLEEFKDEVRAKHNWITRYNNSDTNHDHEKALNAGNNFEYPRNNHIKGKCFNCGHFGHRSVDCRIRKGNNNNNNNHNNNYSNNNNNNTTHRSSTANVHFKTQDDRRKTPPECTYCKKVGHKSHYCFKKRADDKRREEEATFATDDNGIEKEVLLMACETKNESLWIGDSGASCHMTYNDTNMFDVVTISSQVQIGDGKWLEASKKGKKHFTITQQNGDKSNITIELKHVPKLRFNLISITTLISKGFNITNNGQIVILTRNKERIAFDQIKMANEYGYSMGVNMTENIEHACTTIDAINVNTLHNALTHANEKTIRKTAAANGWTVTGKSETCIDCAIANAKQKAKPKFASNPATYAGERLCFDISGISHPKLQWM